MPRFRIPAPRRRWLAPLLAVALLCAGVLFAPAPAGTAFAQTVDCTTLASGAAMTGTAGSGAAGLPTANPQAVYDYAIVIDISRSMSGGGGSQNIFPEVQAAIIDYLDQIPDGANIRIIPFAGQINPRNLLAITFDSDADRQTAIAHVDGLVANGQGTWIYDAVDEALRQLEDLRGNDSHPHIQSLLLYTDGRGNGPNDRPVSTLIERLNVARADQQYLYVKYVALGTDVPGEDELEKGGVDVVKVPQGVAPAPVREVAVAPAALDVGTVKAGQSLAATGQICTTPRIGDASGQQLKVSVDAQSLPDGVEITVDPGTLTIGANAIELHLTLKTAEDVTPGTYRAQLNLASSDADDVVPIPGSVSLNFAVDPPIPPTPTPTPSPTPTPTPGVTLGQRLPLDLGTKKVNLEEDGAEPVTFAGPLEGEFAGGAALTVRLDALDGGNPLSLQIPADVFLRSGDVDGLTEVELEEGSGAVELVARVDPAPARELGDGTHEFKGQLVASAGDATFVPEGAVQQPDGSVILPFVFRVEVYEPFDPVPFIIAGAAGLAGLVLLGLVWSTFPRLPAGSALIAPDGHVEGLRDAQRGRLLGRLFGGGLSIGGNGSDINLGFDGLIGVARGSWFWPKRTRFVPQRDGIRIGGEEVEDGKPRRLDSSEQLQIDRQTYTYVERRQAGRTGRDEDDDFYTSGADEEDDQPRRRRFGRRTRSYDEDDDY